MNRIKLFKEYNSTEFSKLIICDVQRSYSKYITFNMYELSNFINGFDGNMLFLYNGSDLGYGDEYDELHTFYYEYDLYMDGLNQLTYQKNYGMLRSFMDEYGTDLTTDILKYMISENIQSSSNINISNIDIDLDDEMIRCLENDYIYYDDTLLDLLKSYNNCYLIGGSRDECLAEVMCFMDALDMNYEVINKFVY